MNIQPRQLVLHGGALAALLLLAACNRGGDETNVPPAGATAPAPAATTPAMTPTPAGTAPMTPAPSATAPGTMPSSTMPAPATTAPAGSGTSPTAAASGLKVEDLTLGDAVGRGYAITQPTTTFSPSQNTIYASVATSGQTDGATLSAHFRYLEGKGQDVTAISQTIAADGPAVTTFKVHNPNDWPQGKYRVEIALNGQPVTAQTFEVKGA